MFVHPSLLNGTTQIKTLTFENSGYLQEGPSKKPKATSCESMQRNSNFLTIHQCTLFPLQRQGPVKPVFLYSLLPLFSIFSSANLLQNACFKSSTNQLNVKLGGGLDQDHSKTIPVAVKKIKEMLKIESLK